MVSVRERLLGSSLHESNGNGNGLIGRKRLIRPQSVPPEHFHLNGTNGHSPNVPHSLFDSIRQRHNEKKKRKEKEAWERHWQGPKGKMNVWGLVGVALLAGFPTVQYVGVPVYDAIVDHGVDRAAKRLETKLKDFEDYNAFKKFVSNVNELKAGFDDLKGNEFKRALAQFLIDNNIDGSSLADAIEDPEGFLKGLKKKEAKKNKEEANATAPTTTIPK